MSKLYIFGIGGTGSRVLKSLTMLLAAGVRPASSFPTIVPIIIDPDNSAADLTRAVDDMGLYMNIRESFNGVPKGFFNAEIRDVLDGFRLPLENTQDMSFKEYIGYASMDEESRALSSLLFSQKNLDSDMRKGFKGNPNIGSVVLNQFSHSKEFKDFANSFEKGDKIFIVSSIFGGTGASGFPLLLKTLRSEDKNLPNSGYIKDAEIGAITVMPYFNVEQDEESQIDSSTFMSKTKAALSYYFYNISGNNSLNALYYIGDQRAKTYDNCEGGEGQKDAAHIVEMLSALAALDFTFFEPAAEDAATVYKEFGIKKIDDQKKVDFGDFYVPSNERPRTAYVIEKPLTMFTLFSKYLSEVNPGRWGHQPWATKFFFEKRKSFKKDFYKTSCYADILKIQEAYFEWLREMSENDRAFAPFTADIHTGDIFNIVHDRPAKKNYWYHNYALFDDVLNALAPGAGVTSTADRAANINIQFVDLFNDATAKLVEKKIKF